MAHGKTSSAEDANAEASSPGAEEVNAQASSAWDRFWFGEASLVRLGAFRIVVLAVALVAVYSNRTTVFDHADASMPDYLAQVWDPIYAFQVVGLQPMGALSARLVFAVLIAAIALGILGLFSRASCAVAAVLTFVWVGTSYSFGKPHHDLVALMFGLLALPLAPVGARLSIDALIARVRRARRGEDPVDAPTMAPWAALPLRLTQITVAIGYFFAGASKIVIGGAAWANGYTLQGTMLEYNAPWTATFTGSVFLCSLMSIGVLLVQATFPLIFLSRRLRWFYVPMATMFHIMSWKTMATGPFFTVWFMMASFIPLEYLPAFVHARVTSGRTWSRGLWAVLALGAAAFIGELYFSSLPGWVSVAILPLVAAIVLGFLARAELDVVYDGGCGICKTTIAWLAAFDWSRRLRFLDLVQWDRVHALHPTLDRDACLRDMHVVTRGGQVHAGYDGYRSIAWRLPMTILFAPLMSVPGIRHCGRAIYRRVADNRWRTSCSLSSGHARSKPHEPAG